MYYLLRSKGLIDFFWYLRVGCEFGLTSFCPPEGKHISCFSIGSIYLEKDFTFKTFALKLIENLIKYRVSFSFQFIADVLLLIMEMTLKDWDLEDWLDLEKMESCVSGLTSWNFFPFIEKLYPFAWKNSYTFFFGSLLCSFMLRYVMLNLLPRSWNKL